VIRRFSLSYTLFIHISDLLIVVASLAFSSSLRINVKIGAFGADEAFGTPPLLFGIAVVLWQLAFQLLGVYSPIYSAAFVQEVRRVVLGHVLACLLFFGVLYMTYRDYSRLQAAYLIILVLLITIIHRAIVRLFYRASGLASNNHRIVLIVGTDDNARRIGETVAHYDWMGLSLLGYLRHHADDPVVDELAGKVLGTVDRLPALVELNNVDEVIIALKMPDYTYLSRTMEMLQNCVTNIRLAPDYSDLAYFHASMENFGGIPLIALREAVLSPLQRAVKRLLDIIVSGLVLLLGWPIFLIVAVAIRLESKGPILFCQQRVGQHGKLFTMYKFRSMIADAEQLQDKSDVDHKHADDARVTRIGRILRRTSLDELPQFWNILRGDMSLVGPRPEMPWLVDQYESWQRKRFEVPQGLTGWWQVNGRAERPMYLNTEDDLFYISNYSLWLDILIILRTIAIVFTGRGAY